MVDKEATATDLRNEQEKKKSLYDTRPKSLSVGLNTYLYIGVTSIISWWNIKNINKYKFIIAFIFMVVKIAIWIVGSHDFTIPYHQNV